jgi:tRNA threonylcarbamoyladenosine biosynthesis protein TsaE
MQLFLENEQSLLHIAKQLADVAPNNATIYLEGELGAGKTTFARGFIKALDYPGFVKSPTYTIVESYDTPKTKIYHFDLYRIADPQELSFLGIEEYFEQKALRLIEWSVRGKGLLLPADIIVELQFEGTGRKLIITAHSDIGKIWLDKMSS